MSGRDGLIVYGLGSTSLLFFALAFGCYWKSRFHRAKAEVYREFAETFGAMRPMYGLKDKEARRRESQRHWMSLALCDPVIRDGLAAALMEAEEHWNRTSFEPRCLFTVQRVDEDAA